MWPALVAPDIHTADFQKLEGFFLAVGQSSREYLDLDVPVGFCFDQVLEGFGQQLIRIENVILVVEFQGNVGGLGIEGRP